MKKLIAFALALAVALLLSLVAAPAHAFDVSGDVYGNATAGEEIDLSSFYNKAQYPTQITFYLGKAGAAPGNGDCNATVYGQPFGASSGWIPLYMLQANAMSGAASTTIAGVGNATLPITARIGYDGDESWQFKKLKIVPSVTSTVKDTTNGTLYYVVHGK